MKLYSISGLGADQRVFKYLNLPYELVPLEWITPLTKETLKDYALRLSKNIDTTEPFGIIGVSFGGMIAVEISKVLKPEKTILISSAKTKDELPWFIKLLRITKLLPLLPSLCFKLPVFFANYLFGAKNKKLLKAIIKDTDPKFAKWAANAICTWNNEIFPTNILHIHGSKDLLIPLPKDENIKIIVGGGHFMVVDKAEEVSRLIKLSNLD